MAHQEQRKQPLPIHGLRIRRNRRLTVKERRYRMQGARVRGEGRPEHGTARTSPQDAPFTTDFYRNVTESMLREWLDFSQFEKCWVSKLGTDLRFWGLRKTV